MARLLQDVGFVHLHVHSSYSLLEGRAEDRRAGEARKSRPAAGAGAHRHQQSVRRARILREARRLRHPADRRHAALGRFRETADRGWRVSCRCPTNIVLLAQTEEGYRNLMRLVSRAYLGVPLGDAPQRRGAGARGPCEGLIALTGGPDGPARHAPCGDGGRPDLGAGAARRPQERCSADRLYVEIQRHGLDEERVVEARAHRSRLSQWPAAGRHQRAVFCQPPTITKRMTRCWPSPSGRVRVRWRRAAVSRRSMISRRARR